MELLIQRIYFGIDRLPRYANPIPYSTLPENGIYLFFETGETVEVAGHARNRIVRIGTHREDGLFRKRIQQHFGRKRSLGGNKNGSVFRKHLGAALMRRIDKSDPRLPGWLAHMGSSDPQLEEEVSRLLRDRFTFCCFRVDDREERMALEAGLIAILAQHPVGRPSTNWLGHFAAAEGIRRSGLWNTQRLDSAPLSEEGLTRFEELIDRTLGDQSI